eukprot:30358-Pelagococcus_subviridis.AAC.7
MDRFDRPASVDDSRSRARSPTPTRRATTTTFFRRRRVASRRVVRTNRSVAASRRVVVHLPSQGHVLPSPFRLRALRLIKLPSSSSSAAAAAGAPSVRVFALRVRLGFRRVLVVLVVRRGLFAAVALRERRERLERPPLQVLRPARERFLGARRSRHVIITLILRAFLPRRFRRRTLP